jgi:cell division septum initiation protein DivIVA
MEIVPVNMPLVKRDEQLLQIEELIEAKRRMLLEKQKKIRFISKQNKFLDAVKNDYVKYYGYIIKQKRDQIEALDLLNNYIQDLTISGKLSKHNIEDAKHEQSKILNELKNIQKGLDGIINDTHDVTVNLKQKKII